MFIFLVEWSILSILYYTQSVDVRHCLLHFLCLIFGLFLFYLFFRQNIPLVILEEGSYEKDVLLYVNLGEPQMVGGNFHAINDLSK